VGASAAGVEVALVGEDAEVPADGEVPTGGRFPADRG
jgi:hypothetical protein